MAFDINNKISQIEKDLERLEAELDSFNRANYDGSENSNIRKKQKQIKEKQLELLKYRNVKAMQQKDTMEILKLSGFTVDGDIILPQHEAKDDDATEEGAIKEYGKEKGSFEDGWKHYRDSKGNIWELVNPQGSFWMMECIRGPRKGDTATFKKEMVESSMTEDACNKDGGPGSGIKGHTTPENDPDTKYANFMKGRKKPLNYSEGKKLLEEAKKAGIHQDYIKGMERGLAGLKDGCGEKVFTKGTEDDDATRWERRQDWLENQIRKLKSHGDRYSQQMLKGYKEEYDAITRRLSTMNKDAERSVVWVKPSGIEYKIGDIIQFKGHKVKISKITGNVIEATVMDACTKDADPKVAEAEAMINLFGGVK